MNGKNFFYGLLTGALVGGTIALLLAPKSGEETQKDLKEKMDEMKQKWDEEKQKWNKDNTNTDENENQDEK